MFWGLISQVHILKTGVPDVRLKPFPPQGEDAGFEFPPDWRSQHWGWDLLCLSVSYLRWCNFFSYAQCVEVIFRFSSEIVPYGAIDLECPWEEVSLGSSSINHHLELEPPKSPVHLFALRTLTHIAREVLRSSPENLELSKQQSFSFLSMTYEIPFYFFSFFLLF